MKTKIEPLPDYQKLFDLLCTDDFDSIKNLLYQHNSNNSSLLSQLISNIIGISLYSQSFELFDFYVDKYKTLNDYERELLKSISKNQNIHPYCKALVSQYLYEVDRKQNLTYLSLTYKYFLLSLDKTYENTKTCYLILLRLVIIHTAFNKQIGNTKQLHNKILEFPSKHYEPSFYKILKISYKNQIISPEETIKISKDYIEGIEDLYGMHEIIEKYINLIKHIQQKEKNQFCELVNIKKLQWILHDAIELTASQMPNKSMEYAQLLLNQVNLLKKIDYQSTQNERKQLLRERDKIMKQFADSIPYHEHSIEIQKEQDELNFQLNEFKNKESLLWSFLNMPSLNSREILANTEYRMKDCLTLHCSQQTFDINGKLIFKSDGLGNNKDNSVLQSKIKMERCRDSVNYISYVYIHEIQKFMKEKFMYTKEDIEDIVNHSEFIPENRKVLYLKGLWAGFEDDYMTALHILVPQFENSMRELSIQYGDYPYKVDEDGIESSLSLENIIALPKIQELFDDNILLTMRYLFTDNLGLNVRNYIAHGLYDSNFFNSYDVIYVWWFIFKMCYMFYCEE